LKPWILIETAQTPGHGAELCLYQRDQEFAIQADNLELMNSRKFASEQALATLACKKLTDPSEARVLIGGLGMGYTLKSALDELGETAEVLVMELVPDVVRWNQGLLAHLAGNPLEDERVTVMEKTNARHPFDLPEQVDLIVIDVSFISLTMVIPEAVRHLDPGRYIAALVKPQFEAQKSQVGRGGVIKDPKVHADVLGNTVNWAVGQGLRVRNMCRSPIQGDAGNREFFILFQKPED